jgi:hypothetical protein
MWMTLFEITFTGQVGNGILPSKDRLMFCANDFDGALEAGREVAKYNKVQVKTIHNFQPVWVVK